MPSPTPMKTFTILLLDYNGHGNSSWNGVKNQPPSYFYHATNEFCRSGYIGNHQYCVTVHEEVPVGLAIFLSNFNAKFGPFSLWQMRIGNMSN